MAKGDESSLELYWSGTEIDYGDITTINAERKCTNLLGYRLGEKDGLNEGKLLAAKGDSSGEWVVTDKTLSIENAPADAKAVGEALKNVEWIYPTTISAQPRENGVCVTPKTNVVANGNCVLANILSGQSFDVTSNTDVQKALGVIITALGGTATNVPTT